LQTQEDIKNWLYMAQKQRCNTTYGGKASKGLRLSYKEEVMGSSPVPPTGGVFIALCAVAEG